MAVGQGRRRLLVSHINPHPPALVTGGATAAGPVATTPMTLVERAARVAFNILGLPPHSTRTRSQLANFHRGAQREPGKEDGCDRAP